MAPPTMLPPPEAQTVPLFHRELGGSLLPAVVILHGMLGSSRNWQTAGRHLAEHRRVIALDLRNHGLSPHAGTMTYEAMVADVLGWMDGQGLQRVELVGHSMGGKAAMLLACRHPQRVSGLVVVDISPKDYGGQAHRDEFAAMNELELGGLRSRAEAETRMEGRVPSWAMRKFLATNLERSPDGTFRWLVNLPVMTAVQAVLERNPLSPGDRFGGPALFVIGGKSSYVSGEDREQTRRHFPRARFLVLEGSGHNPHIDSREALVAAIAASLAAPEGT